MSNFDELVEKIKNEIRTMLRDSDKRPDYMTHAQLSDVQNEICKMARIRDFKKFVPYYPKGMADACWPSDHPLVIKLNKLLDMYMNIYRFFIFISRYVQRTGWRIVV